MTWLGGYHVQMNALSISEGSPPIYVCSCTWSMMYTNPLSRVHLSTRAVPHVQLLSFQDPSVAT